VQAESPDAGWKPAVRCSVVAERRAHPFSF
jgi:hypothetical protein